MPINVREGAKAWFATPPGLVGVLLGAAVGTVGVKIGFGPLKVSILFTLLALVVSIMSSGGQRLLSYRPSKLELTSVIFLAGLVCIELFNAIDLRHSPRFDVAIQWASYSIGFAAARLVMSDELSKVAYLRGFVLLAPLSALIGVMQLLDFSPVVDFVLDITESSSALGRIERNATTRATGLIGHWTGLGGYLLVMTLAYLVMHYHRSKLGGTEVRLPVTSIGLLGVGALSTLTLSVISSFAVVVLVYLWTTRRLGVIALSALSATLVGITAFGTFLETRLQEQFGYNPGALAQTNGILPETLAYRLDIWSTQTLRAIFERPLTGWGQGFYREFGQWSNFPTYMTWPSAESQWLLILVNAGTLGLVLFILPLGQIVLKLRHQQGSMRSVVSAFLIVSFITSLTVPLFTNAGLPAAFVCLLAIFYSTPDDLPRVDPLSLRRPHLHTARGGN